MIDRDGYRFNVGIILANDENKLFWGRRIGHASWQFPQGGMKPQESPEEAMFRELWEEVGLEPDDVLLLAQTPDWLRYRLPEHLVRRGQSQLCIGQKQKWFLLRLLSSEKRICLECSARPEFDQWRWVSYWQPAREVVFFKRQVYRQALQFLAPQLFSTTFLRR